MIDFPLPFVYWLVGLAVACGRLDLGLIAVIVLMAMAILTNLRAKLTGEFSLAAFGPTEFKALLIAFGVALAALSLFVPGSAQVTCLTGLASLTTLGLILLPIQLWQSVHEVNRNGGPPDTSEWETARANPPSNDDSQDNSVTIDEPSIRTAGQRASEAVNET